MAPMTDVSTVKTPRRHDWLRGPVPHSWSTILLVISRRQSDTDVVTHFAVMSLSSADGRSASGSIRVAGRPALSAQCGARFQFAEHHYVRNQRMSPLHAQSSAVERTVPANYHPDRPHGGRLTMPRDFSLRPRDGRTIGAWCRSDRRVRPGSVSAWRCSTAGPRPKRDATAAGSSRPPRYRFSSRRHRHKFGGSDARIRSFGEAIPQLSL